MRLGRFAQCLGPVEVNRDELADAALAHRNTVEAVHAGHGHAVVGDDEKSCPGPLHQFFDQRAETIDVGIVERRVDISP